MKKFLLIIMAIVFFGVTANVKAIELPEVTDHEKVTIYIFRGHGCSHCYDALEYFYNNLSKYSDYIDLKAYEVWNDSTNKSLVSAILEKFGETSSGVPYFVIGDSYSGAGFGSSTGEELIEHALKEYQNKKYKDVVAQVIKDNKIDANVETLAEACEEEGITGSIVADDTDKKGGKYDTVIVIGILVVLIGGTVALVLSNRKDN